MNPDRKADMRADRQGAGSDPHEPISFMEPMLISESSRVRNGLADLAVEIAARSAGFKRSLPRGIVAALADLVRSINCYYSNLIEGHDTHPIDIEHALKNDFSKDVGKRNLQLEAKAHIEVQRWIDEGGIRGRAATSAAICEIHRRFCRKVP
jgi:Fic family protein